MRLAEPHRHHLAPATLHEAKQGLAIRRDAQAFHALVGHPAGAVASDFGRPKALRLDAAKVFGKEKVLMRAPVVRSNWYT